jgi:hypothetical protein
MKLPFGIGAESLVLEGFFPVLGGLGKPVCSDCFLISSKTPLVGWLFFGLMVSSMEVSQES